jgi:alpha-mannosidase
MYLSLLRAPKWPDPKADMGRHRFSYALYPHADGWREAGVVAESYRFNVPLVWGRGAAGPRSLFHVGDRNLVLDTVKRAEDDRALVLRLYEAHGARGTARLETSLPFRAAHLCNLLEDTEAPLASGPSWIDLPYRPYQILSVKLL